MRAIDEELMEWVLESVEENETYKPTKNSLLIKKVHWLSQSIHATHKQLKEQCAWCQRHLLQSLARKQEMATYAREWRLGRFFPILKLRKSSIPKSQLSHEKALSCIFPPFVFMKIICHYVVFFL